MPSTALPAPARRDRTARPQHRPARDAIAVVRSLGRRRAGRHRDAVARVVDDLERHGWSLTDLLDESLTPGAPR